MLVAGCAPLGFCTDLEIGQKISIAYKLADWADTPEEESRVELVKPDQDFSNKAEAESPAWAGSNH